MIRLSKLMADRKIASRREADRLIEAGLVRVNGEIVSTLGAKFPESVFIELLPQGKKVVASKVTILLNKPVGFVSNLPEKGYRPAIDLIAPENQYLPNPRFPFCVSHRAHLAVAGRLDIDSKGLLVLTQDGVIAKQLIGENSQVEKEYQVHVEGVLDDEGLKKLTFGLALDGQPLKRAKIALIHPGLLHFTLQEGKKRQIRRMCELVGLKVTGLKRIRIGHVRLGPLPEGQWRYLLPNEHF